MAHTFTHLLSHIVFSTKNRQPTLLAEMKPTLFAYMGGILRELDCKALAINGPKDHLHLLISQPATISMSEILRVLKTNSSKWVHESRSDYSSFGWQTGYSAFSVSQSNREAVERYIRDQEERHRKISFREELIELLKRHGIEYDERFVCD